MKFGEKIVKIKKSMNKRDKNEEKVNDKVLIELKI